MGAEDARVAGAAPPCGRSRAPARLLAGAPIRGAGGIPRRVEPGGARRRRLRPRARISARRRLVAEAAGLKAGEALPARAPSTRRLRATAPASDGGQIAPGRRAGRPGRRARARIDTSGPRSRLAVGRVWSPPRPPPPPSARAPRPPPPPPPPRASARTRRRPSAAASPRPPCCDAAAVAREQRLRRAAAEARLAAAEAAEGTGSTWRCAVAAARACAGSAAGAPLANFVVSSRQARDPRPRAARCFRTPSSSTMRPRRAPSGPWRAGSWRSRGDGAPPGLGGGWRCRWRRDEGCVCN